ncbi:MAG: AAA family ATPase [Candidatus Entotheonellia bacterium]
MYTDYFGFSEKPFSVTPDPRFFYTNPSYQEAYASLLYGIHERRGFIVLTGEIGTGKTTLLRRLMENMEPNVRFVFFYNTTLTFEELLDFICDELGLPIKEAGRLQKIQMLNQFLMDQLARGGTVVLLIDEAQNLGEEVLENLRLLSNLETASEKLLQIVMVGQPELETKLNQPELRQLKQRIAIQCRLERLDDEEVGPFITYRLNTVGYKRQQLFMPDAVQEIAYYSKGFPRLINILCDNALLIAYATSQKRITADIIREAAGDLRLELPRSKSFVAEGDRQSSGEVRLRKSPGSVPSERAAFHGKPSDGSRRGLRIVIIMLLLGIGGMGLYTWRVNASFLEDFGGRLGTLPHTLHNTIGGWIGDRGPSGSRLDGHQQATGNEESKALSRKTGPASATDLLTIEPPKESRDNRLLAEQTSAATEGNTSTSGGGGNDKARSVANIPAIASWREKPIAMQPGSTIAEIAANIYGAQRNLGLDLIKEYNTHIENLNRIIAGQRLWLPPLSRETLVRQQPDGSYSLILASFRSPQQSEQLVQTARLKGYDVVVTPRRVSDNLMLHRVEISRLENVDAVNKAWETALANQWVTFVENESGPGKRF